MPTKIVETHGRKELLEAIKPELAALVPLTIKDGFAVERGRVLGVITAEGLGRKRTRTPATGAGFAVNSPVGHVADASVFVAGDVLTKADGTNIGTIQSVNISANTVTLTGNAAVAVTAGADVLGSDGSQVAQAISDDASDGVGNTTVSVFISGLLKQAKLIGLDASAKTELSGASVAGDIFKF